MDLDEIKMFVHLISYYRRILIYTLLLCLGMLSPSCALQTSSEIPKLFITGQLNPGAYEAYFTNKFLPLVPKTQPTAINPGLKQQLEVATQTLLVLAVRTGSLHELEQEYKHISVIEKYLTPFTKDVLFLLLNKSIKGHHWTLGTTLNNTPLWLLEGESNWPLAPYKLSNTEKDAIKAAYIVGHASHLAHKFRVPRPIPELDMQDLLGIKKSLLLPLYQKIGQMHNVFWFNPYCSRIAYRGSTASYTTSNPLDRQFIKALSLAACQYFFGTFLHPKACRIAGATVCPPDPQVMSQ